MVELLQDAKFPLQAFKLDRQCLPPVTPNVVNAIGLKYKRLFLQAKTIFYIKQVKVEIACLKMLITHSCCRINELKLELKYPKRLEETRAKEASIFITMWK